VPVAVERDLGRPGRAARGPDANFITFETNYAGSVLRMATIPLSDGPVGVGAPTMTDIDVKL
jgi:hypothetical protein